MNIPCRILLCAAAFFPAQEAIAQPFIVNDSGMQTREEQRSDEKAQLREYLDSEEAEYYVDVRRFSVSFHPSDDSPESLGAFEMALKGSECVARTVSKDVRKALETQPMSRNDETRLKRAFNKGKGCTKYPTPILSLQRGLLAHGSYINAHQSTPAFPGSVDPALINRFRVEEGDWNKARSHSDRILMNAANCLVLNDLHLADAIVRARHGSKAEEQMMDRLFSENAKCAGPGRPPNVSKTFLRSFLSDALYRASVHERTAPIFGAASL